MTVYSGRLTNVDGNRTPGPGPNQFTFTNFRGSGVDVTVETVGDVLVNAGGAQETGTLAVGVSPPANVQVNVTFRQPIYLRSFGITDLDDSVEDAFDFTPQVNGVYGTKVLRPVTAQPCHGALAANNPIGMVHDSVQSGAGGVTFDNVLTSTLTFTYGRCGTAGLGAFLTELAFADELPETIPCDCCPIMPRVSMCAAPDLVLPLTPAGGLVQVNAGASGGVNPRQYSVTNWVGTGINADIFVFWTGPAPSFSDPSGIGVGLGGTYRYIVQFTNGPHRLRYIDLQDLDAGGEQLFNFGPPLAGVTGAGIILNTICAGTGAPPPQCVGCGCVRSVIPNANGLARWPNTLSNFASWTIALPGAFGSAFNRIVIADPNVTQAFACRDGNVTIWHDENGNVIPAANVFPCT